MKAASRVAPPPAGRPSTAQVDRPSLAVGEDSELSVGAPAPNARSFRLHIKLLKVVLPIVALALVLVVVVWPQIRPNMDRLQMTSLPTAEPGSDSESAINARYQGEDQQGQPFSIVADTIKDVDSEGSRMQLAQPRAEITLKDGEVWTLAADSGLYDRAQKLLDLGGTVTLASESGYRFRTTQAHIDLNTNIASGSAPVQGNGPFGKLAAQGFRITDQGQTVFFNGQAKMVVTSNSVSQGR